MYSLGKRVCHIRKAFAFFLLSSMMFRVIYNTA